MKQGGKVAGGRFVEGFVGKEEDFEMDVLGDWEPMELVKNGDNVVTRAGVGE